MRRPAIRLYCLPHSGGTAAVFRSWPEALPPDVEVQAAQLPGRETRIAEPPVRRLELLVEPLAAAIAREAQLPFALFGHSLGGLLAFEVCRRLRRLGAAGPVQLFVAGCRAPHLPSPDPPIHALPDEEFLVELRRLNGTPADVLEHRELLRLVMPSLRADCEAAETYSHRPEPALGVPIAVYGGTDDDRVDFADLAAWRRHTTGDFSLRMLPGDHFFVTESEAELLALVSERLDALTRRWSPAAG